MLLCLFPSAFPHDNTWPAMDPASNNPSPSDRLERIEHTLQCHGDLITASTSHLNQATDAQTKKLAALAEQLQQLVHPGVSCVPSPLHATAPLLVPDAPKP